MDSLPIDKIVEVFREFGPDIGDRSIDTSKTYVYPTDQYVKSLTIFKRNAAVWGLSFFCVKKDHIKGLHIDGDLYAHYGNK